MHSKQVNPTIVRKANYGNQWGATTYFHLDNGMQLHVSTGKAGDISTLCQAMNVKDGSESFILLQDFRKRIMKFPEVKRATEKSITECHNKALQLIDEVLKEANEFYKPK